MINDNDKEVDLGLIFHFLIRNKKIIILGSLISLLSSALISFKLQKIWQGEFQIVLQSRNQDKDSGAKLTNISNNALRFLNRSNQEDIQTQISILKSPSVLMPIFEFVKSEKIKKGKNVNNWIFKKWSEDFLTIELEKGTKVLNIAYRDNEKAIIPPTLDLISKTYQEYSGKQREENIKLTLLYLENEIEEYQRKNKISQRKLVEYSLKNDLELPEINSKSLNSSSEQLRSLTINNIKLIDQQILSLNKLDNSKETLKFISLIAGTYEDRGIIKFISLVEELNQDANSKATFFKDTYIFEEKKLLEKSIQVLKNDFIKSLVARKRVLENKLKSIERPLEKLIKQRELLLNAKLEFNTIEKLQGDKRLLALEQKKILPPWELITNPTLLESPVKPSKKRITVIGGFIGFVILSILCSLKEFQIKVIYDENKLIQKIGKKSLINLTNSSNELIKVFFKNLNQEIIENNKKYGLFIIGELGNNSFEKLNSYINNYLSQKEVMIDKSFSNIKSFNELILVTSLGKINLDQIDEVNKLIQITDIKITGFIII